MITDAERQFVRELAARLGQYQYGEFQTSGADKYIMPRADNGKLAPLPPTAIDRHLSGEQPIALPSVSHCDENKAQVIVYDFDDHDGTFDEQRMVETVCDFSASLDLPHNVERSGSGTGYHIWLVFDRPIRRDVLLDAARRRLGTYNDRHPDRPLEKGAKGGVAAGKVEIFPTGSLIALPLGREKSMFVKPVRVDGKWTLPRDTEPKLTLISRQKSGPKSATRGGQKPDRDAAFNALVSKRDPSDYEHWVNVARLLRAAFEDAEEWAFKRWLEWAQSADDPDPLHKQEKKWAKCAEHGLSPATFWLEAKAAGYNGALPFSKREERQQEVQNLLQGVELHKGEDGLPYALVGPRRLAIVESEEFHDFLRLTASDQGGMIKTEEVRELSALSAARARAKDPTAIALRFGRDGNKRFVFHADSQCRVTEIDAEGWRPCEQPPILFRRGDGKPLAQPVSSELDVFQRVLNISDDALIVLLAWMVHAIYAPAAASPIAKVTGPQGSTKTSAMRAIVNCMDPKIGSFAGPPKSEQDLMVAANGSAVVSFDNASSLAMLSDAFCRLSTSGGTRDRKLFTNHGIAALDVTRPIILTGIDPVVYKQDLIERLVDVPLTRPQAYLSEEGLRDLLAECGPRMTGALFTLLSQVLCGIDHIPSAQCFRYDTFARIGECTAQIMHRDKGWFVSAYKEQLAEGAGDAALGDCVLQFILFLCGTMPSDQRRLELHAMPLFDLLHQKVQNREIIAARDDVPGNARVLAQRINTIVPSLNDYGVRVRRGQEKSYVFEWEGADMDAMDRFMNENKAVPF